VDLKAISPSSIFIKTEEHYNLCHQLGLYSVPVSFFFIQPTNYFFLVFNSSINFVLYCCVGREFRQGLKDLFAPCKSLWAFKRGKQRGNVDNAISRNNDFTSRAI